MAWTERTEWRTRTSRTYQDGDNPLRHIFEQRIKTILHYPTAGPDSDVLDGIMDMTPRRVDVPTFDGWLVTDADWYYALGMPKTGALANLDGVVGFGGRQGQNWFKYRLQSAGYLRGSTRNWVSLGTANYNRANLSQQTEALPVGPNGDTVNVMSTATWADLWPALPNGRIDVRWRAEGRRLKEEIVISQAAREWIAANRGPAWAFPGVALSDIWFGFAFRLDWADIPKVTIAGVQQSFDSDFSDDGGPVELRDALDRLLAFMPLDDVFVPGAENTENGRTALRKRLWRDGDGNHYLLVGVRYDALAGLVAGDLVFDPTLDLQPDAAAGLDTNVRENGADTSYATLDSMISVAGSGVRRNILIKFDLSSIPGGSVVSSSALSEWSNAALSAGITVSIHPILSANGAWTEAGATWNYAVATTTRWAGDTGNNGGTDAGCSVSGIDYGSSIGSFSTGESDVLGTQYDTAINASGMESVIAANYGFVQINSSTNVANLRSSDYATAAYRPRLVVVYTEAGGAPRRMLLGVGV